MADREAINVSPDCITEENQHQAIEQLIRLEPLFAKVIEPYGAPPLWQRPKGFATLIRIILEQQVSLASAKAAFDRLQSSCEVLTPQRFLEFSDDELKAMGFSRQKAHYGRHLALAIDENRLKLADLDELEDEQVREGLTKVKGVGIWTANIYLLMAMQRPDVWPRGDIALAAAYQQLAGLAKRPENETMEDISQHWQPWRSLAARMLWHYYLSERAA